MLPAVQPLSLENLSWRVVLVDGVPLFALDAQGYSALARNVAEMTRWAGEASWQMDYYRRSRDAGNTQGDAK